ncbi:LysR family transcriptional regulator [Shewanella olleyana]|uniref:LysR family transcriptional regulator n=1 Tax=Shewanella olleyana TaxID=135626 RepID=UPI00200F9872|nr:LysR family transcriptional regulator [Shewanella olleyana]MCL1068602.1 LysR family transcriptional regulator [Shewanella olleyana]
MNTEINLVDIRAFVVIAEQRNFTLAAEVLGGSRSHLSKQLLSLETFLGVSLIIRTTRTQRLTEQGESFLLQCQQALQQIDLAVATTVESAEQLKGNIYINCVGGVIGEEIVVQLVNDFIQLYPDITVDLDFSSQRVDLIEDHFDAVFRMGELADSGLIARKLMDIKNCTLASPEYLAQYGHPTHPNQLNKFACIVGSINHWRFEKVGSAKESIEVAIKGNFRCKNGRAMKVSALAGNGIVRLPYLYCPEEIRANQLVEVFTDWHIPDTPFYVLYHKDKFQPERLKKFIQFTHEKFKTYLPDL